MTALTTNVANRSHCGIAAMDAVLSDNECDGTLLKGLRKGACTAQSVPTRRSVVGDDLASLGGSGSNLAPALVQGPLRKLQMRGWAFAYKAIRLNFHHSH